MRNFWTHSQDKDSHVFVVSEKTDPKVIEKTLKKLKKFGFKRPKIRFVHTFEELSALSNRLEELNKSL